jgi:hypothetical protein
MQDIEILTNGIELAPFQEAEIRRIAERLNATFVSLYRRSDGLFAYVVDEGNGEHLGVKVSED